MDKLVISRRGALRPAGGRRSEVTLHISSWRRSAKPPHFIRPPRGRCAIGRRSMNLHPNLWKRSLLRVEKNPDLDGSASPPLGTPYCILLRLTSGLLLPVAALVRAAVVGMGVVVEVF